MLSESPLMSGFPDARAPRHVPRGRGVNDVSFRDLFPHTSAAPGPRLGLSIVLAAMLPTCTGKLQLGAPQGAQDPSSSEGAAQDRPQQP